MSEIDQIVKGGLALIYKPQEFLLWAGQWYGNAETWCGIYTDIDKWAWKARGIAGESWELACTLVYQEVGLQVWDTMTWMTLRSSPYHWILAGIVALEMKKEPYHD